MRDNAMTTDSGTELAKKFFSANGATYDRIATLSTLGFDTLWKKKILKMMPQDPKQIIDQACGTGILTFKLAKMFPQCHVVGVELNDEYLSIARQKAEDLHVANVEFILGRAEDITLEAGAFDCITSAYLAKYAELDRLVANARGMLRKGGVLIMHELTCPSNPAYAILWKLQFKFLQTYGVRKYPEWKTAFLELPVLLRTTKWVDELTTALIETHFTDIAVESLAFDTSAIVKATK
jgi:demethylmenaquinone methyltransferase/2-methoxy-6-polyprenyl-1,4-benzoquinol methylase